ncbi:hypothetical protein OI18_17580 [Flavihumibacter solisilvae]|uniref:Uncharacterized protein n=1 Tax=Flavihumibacter solisilvae TaxID=1349421 RepID=A0A0C1IH97_9BACT|nr:hypothetical protein OI18_17580 [Flavihumibacter solisilvae]
MFSLGIIALLQANYLVQSREKRKFLRIFPPHILGTKKELPLAYNSFYFAGQSSKAIYLANHTAPSYILNVNKTLRDTQVIKLFPPALTKTLPFPNQVIFQDSRFMLTSTLTNIIYVIQPGNPIDSITMDLPAGIADFQIVHGNIALTKTYDTTLKQRILVMLDLRSGKPLYRYFPQALGEGLFSTNGTFSFSKEKKITWYVHAYWNKVVALDSLLRPFRTFTTIDGTGSIPRPVMSTNQEGQLTVSGPASAINQHVCLAENYLLVHSTLPAQNEPFNSVRTFWAVDAYHSTRGSYQFSFYLPFEEGNKPIDFLYADSHLYVLYGHKLISYSLSLPILSD